MSSVAIKWKELATVSLDARKISNPVRLTNNTFLISSENVHLKKQTTNTQPQAGIMQYNTDDNKWKLFIEYSNIDMRIWYHRIALSNSKQMLYFQGLRSQLIALNLKTKQFKVHVSDYKCGSDPAIVIVNDTELHCFCGYKSNKHQIWDNNKCEWILKYEFKKHVNLHRHGVVYVPSKQCLLMFGGQDSKSNLVSNYIYSYSLLQNVWIELDIKLPIGLFGFGYILTFDQNYIIIFGGIGSKHTQSNKIYVFDLNKMKIFQSKIKCPVIGSFHAINMQNKIKERILVYGYIRYIWSFLKMKNYMYLPDSLINLISSFYSEEFVYLIQYWNAKGKLWRIDVKDILI